MLTKDEEEFISTLVGLASALAEASEKCENLPECGWWDRYMHQIHAWAKSIDTAYWEVDKVIKDCRNEMGPKQYHVMVYLPGGNQYQEDVVAENPSRAAKTLWAKYPNAIDIVVE